jgi:hypothetical protein
MLKENYEERIQFVILELSNIKMEIEKKMKQRIISHSSIRDVEDNLRFWDFITPKFKWWKSGYHLDSHINDLNVLHAYIRAINRLENIIQSNVTDKQYGNNN